MLVENIIENTFPVKPRLVLRITVDFVSLSILLQFIPRSRSVNTHFPEANSREKTPRNYDAFARSHWQCGAHVPVCGCSMAQLGKSEHFSGTGQVYLTL